MLKRWQTLTRFLSVPGAPLDNNDGYAARGIMLSGVSAMVRPENVENGLDVPPNHCGYTAIELNR
jgi:hypothetical protein